MMIGKTIGKYQIVERLGRGGMGTVYKAIDETLDREVAIKVLNPTIGDTELLKRFRAEAVTLARLNHPGIATLYELDRQDDDLLMVMEFVRGETFHDLSERLGPIAPPQAAQLCMQVLEALAHAHRAGVVHRDLKPANLMITEMGAVKVMDFGIARVLGTEGVTQSGYMMGTPAYMAPEQVLGNEIDARADLYAAGVVFYRLLTSHLPFDADTAIAMVQKQISEAPMPVTTFCPDLPEWCSHVLDRALSKVPADRFQSAEEFRTALQLAARPQPLGELPTTSTPTPPGLRVDPDITVAHGPGVAARSSGVSSRPAPAVASPVSAARTADAGGAATPSGAPGVERTTGTTVVLGRTHLLAMAALVLVLAIGVAVLGFAALRRSSFGEQLPMLGTLPQASAPAAATPGSDAESTAAESASTNPAPPVEQASNRDVAATAGAGAPASQGGDAARPGGTASPSASLDDAKKAIDSPPAAETPAVKTTPDPKAAEPKAADPAAAAASPVVFDDVRVLITDPENKGREREAVLQFGNGRLTVLERVDGPIFASLPYKAVVGAFYSRSKQPKWKDAKGNDVESEVDLGPLGFFRGDRNWLILLTTQAEPLIIRVDDSDLKAVLPALTEHTGIPIQR